MKLIELNPRWLVGSEWIDERGTICRVYGNNRHGMGVAFECPVHRDHMIAIMFQNPVDGLPPERNTKHLWFRNGDNFETITLSPSIDAGVSFEGCWHGFIQNGEIT